MATAVDWVGSNPTYFSEDDSEDDALNLDAYLKVGTLQNQEDTGNPQGKKLGGGLKKANSSLSRAKTGTQDKAVDPDCRSGMISKDSSPTKSKDMGSRKQETISKAGGSAAKTSREMGELTSGASSSRKEKKTQRPLKTTQVNSLLLPLSDPVTEKKREKVSRHTKKAVPDQEQNETESNTPMRGHLEEARTPKPKAEKRNISRTTSKRSTKKEVNYQLPGNGSENEKNDDLFDSLADFIVSDNEDVSLYESHAESEDERKKSKSFGESRPRGRLIRGQTPKSTLKKKDATEHAREHKEPAGEGALSRKPVDITLPPSLHLKPTTLFTEKKETPGKPCLSQDSDELQESDTLLKHSPPQSYSPPTMEGGAEFITPPSSPSKPRLKSPTKEKHRIPASPHRPSIDAFWSQDVINEWNDQYSPKKEQSPFRRRMMMLLEENEEDVEDKEDSLNPSPKKGGASPSKISPTKARAAAAEAKKALARKKKEFDERKVALAENFLKELDDKVTGGEVQKLAEATGGVKIVWSKKLNSTAGRANWKREVIRSKTTTPPTGADDTITTTTQTSRHHATIELAEKVIDSNDRLINTLAHEYCHLTNFMISNVRNNPHGASFKEWARKCTVAFADHPVYGGGKIQVTTKHSYVISYKYLWCCEGCGLEYGRHSKSIDPVKVRCGRCKGSLRQVRPKPRKAGGGSPQKKKPAEMEREMSPVVHMLVDDEDEGVSSGVEAVTKDLADVKLRS